MQFKAYALTLTYSVTSWQNNYKSNKSYKVNISKLIKENSK